MEEPNVLYKTGSCDKCPTITDIEKQGCNYLMHVEGSANVDEFIKADLK